MHGSVLGQSAPPSGCRPWPRFAAAAVATASLVAQAAPPVAETYNLRPLVHAEVVQDMQRCVGPRARPDQLQAFVAKALGELADGDPTRAAQLATPEAAGVVLAAAGQWACVPLSSEGFPLWPVEALHGVIVPVGVPAALTRAWRRHLLDQVARDGVGRGLIVYPGGEADQVHVIAEQRQALQIKLSMRLLPAGSYREQQYSAVLRHPGLTRLVTRSSGTGVGTPWRMAIPPHRLLQPVHDGFVVVQPTVQTRHFAFVGTQWLLGGEAGTVTLQAGGAVVRSAAEPGTSPATATRSRSAQTLGRWRVADGVLQLTLSDGTRYALTLHDSAHTLVGIGRRADEDAPEDEGGETQWPARLHRHGAPQQGQPGAPQGLQAAGVHRGPGQRLAGQA